MPKFRSLTQVSDLGSLNGGGSGWIGEGGNEPKEYDGKDGERRLGGG